MGLGSFLKKSFKKGGGFGFITKDKGGDKQINPRYRQMIGGALSGLANQDDGGGGSQMPMEMVTTGDTPDIPIFPQNTAIRRPMRRRGKGWADYFNIDDYEQPNPAWQSRPTRGLRYGGRIRDGETVIVGEDGEEIVTKTPDGEVVVEPVSEHEKIRAAIQQAQDLQMQGQPVIEQSPTTASMSGKITDPNNVFYTPPQPVRDQQPAEYYPNGIRKRPMDERDPSGEPIGGQSSDIERSTWNPDYNPAHDQSRKDYRPQPPVASPNVQPTPSGAYEQPNMSGTLSGTVTNEEISPADAMYQRVRTIQDRLAKGKAGYDDKKKDWKDILRGIGLGALRGLGNADPRQGIAGMLGSALGGAGYGGVRTGIDRTYDNQMQDENKLFQLYPQYEQMAKVERDKAKFEGARAREAAVIDDFGRKKDAEKRIGENQIRDDRNAILKGLYGTGFNSKQPTKAQLLALQSVGLTPEDVGDVRQTNPRTGVVGGVQFEQDAITGEWKDSGRPHDPTEAFVSMQVNDADGNDMGTFTVSQKNKAQFVTQLVSAGYQTKKAEYNEIREIKRRNADKRTKYEQELRDYDAQFKTSQGAIQAAEDALIDLDTAITALNGEIAGTLDEDAKKALRSNLNTLQTSKRNQQKEIAKLKGTKIARPVKPSYEDENVNMPSNSGMVGGKTVSQAELAAFAKSQGWSSEQAKQYAASQGWVIR